MGEITGISWCDHTFNYVWGCTEITPECDNCYAREWAKRMGFPNAWSGEYRLFSDSYWREPLKWNRKAIAAGERRRVFTSSMADVFDMKAPETQRRRLFDVIWQCQGLDWLILTKRPAQAREYLLKKLDTAGRMKWPWPNVWLGVTAGSQPTADAFIPIALTIPAYVRWISHEPAISEVRWLASDWSFEAFGIDDLGTIQTHVAKAPQIHWIISGGESGGNARPISSSEFLSAKRACRLASIPWFMKQMGTVWAKGHYAGNSEKFRQDQAGKIAEEWSAELRVQEFPESVYV